MIDQATGMKPGERYCVENLERAHQFPGFFQDGKYYLGPELLTAVGWLEGDRFIYDSLDAEGAPVFPDRVAGTINDLTLNLVDGTALQLSPMAVSETFTAPIDDPISPIDEPPPLTHSPIRGPLRGSVEGAWRTAKGKTPLLLSAAVIGFVAGFVITHSQRRRR
ncbi:hypothetical protein DMX11_21585 [Pseudomonas sp. LB-090624]|nr:hypothetical protein DMX11_21585 [Pseudomonas sp. LB-090624]